MRPCLDLLAPLSLVASLVVSCDQATSRHAAAPQPCPPEIAIASVHAAAFWLEHDGTDVEIKHLLEAARQTVSTPNATDTEILKLVEECERALAQRSAGNPSWRITVETARAELSEWPCLYAELHKRLHQELPPVR